MASHHRGRSHQQHTHFKTRGLCLSKHPRKVTKKVKFTHRLVNSYMHSKPCISHIYLSKHYFLLTSKHHMDTVDMKEEIIETTLEHFLLFDVNLLCQYIHATWQCSSRCINVENMWTLIVMWVKCNITVVLLIVIIISIYFYLLTAA